MCPSVIESDRVGVRANFVCFLARNAVFGRIASRPRSAPNYERSEHFLFVFVFAVEKVRALGAEGGAIRLFRRTRGTVGNIGR